MTWGHGDHMEVDGSGQFMQVARTRLLALTFVVSVVVCVVLAGGFLLFGLVKTGGVSELTWDDKINPNDAVAASLVRLPGIGIVRAKAIVAYREDIGTKEPAHPVFRQCSDLLKVDGIGVKTVDRIGQYLRFEK